MVGGIADETVGTGDGAMDDVICAVGTAVVICVGGSVATATLSTSQDYTKPKLIKGCNSRRCLCRSIRR